MAAPSTGNDYQDCHHVAAGVGLNAGYTCGVHGGRMEFELATCQTVDVLSDVRAERARQFAKYGDNSYLEDGTGPDVPWLGPFTGAGALDIEQALREDYGLYKAVNGEPSWLNLVREEMAEAFKEVDPTNLRAELIQVAALAVSWVEKIDARKEGL